MKDSKMYLWTEKIVWFMALEFILTAPINKIYWKILKTYSDGDEF
jgi:hypothetical protein